MRTLLLLLLGILGFAPQARAQWQAKSNRDPLPAREVERPLVLPRGWIEVDVGYDQHLAWGQWTREGKAKRFEDVHWVQYTETFRLAYGISRRAELWWELPFHQGRISNDRWPAGEATFDHTIGDQRFGWRLQVLRTEAPASSLMVDTWVKAPTAKEAPGNYIGGPLNQQQILFTTGTSDWYIGAAYKRAFGPLGLSAWVGWLHRFSAVVQYLIELDELQFSGRIKPGDQARARVEVLFQAGPVVLAATPEFAYRLVTKAGTTSPGFLTPNKYLDPVVGSAGLELDARFDLRINITRGFDLGGYYRQPILGEDLDFFPIEDLHPTWGPDFGGYLRGRF